MNFNPLTVKFKDDADTIIADIIKEVNEYNFNLDDQHEVGVMLASFGQSITVNITGIGSIGAKLVKFSGYSTETGIAVELFQHVSQLNFLLVSLPVKEPEKPKKAIGFIQ